MRKERPWIALVVALSFFLVAAAPVHARAPVARSHLPSVLIRITDAVSNLPVPGAEVVVTFIEGDPDHPIVVGPLYTRRANPGGLVLFKGLPQGDYIVAISADGYVKFGDGAHGDRPPQGAHIMVSYSRGGAGNQPVHLRLRLIPLLCRDCG